jgi:hypothetical protein
VIIELEEELIKEIPQMTIVFFGIIIHAHEVIKSIMNNLGRLTGIAMMLVSHISCEFISAEFGEIQ